MSFEPLRDKIKTILEGIDSIQYVYSYPTEDYDGYPCAIIRSMRNESDYETTNDNIRTYIFAIYLIQESESTAKGRRQARRILEGLSDEIVDTFDKDELLSGISLSDKYTIVGIRPAVSEIVDEDGFVSVEIGLAIRMSFDKT